MTVGELRLLVIDYGQVTKRVAQINGIRIEAPTALGGIAEDAVGWTHILKTAAKHEYAIAQIRQTVQGAFGSFWIREQPRLSNDDLG